SFLMLQAVSVLRKYVEVIDDPLARKFDVMLGVFRRETRALGMQSMKDTSN
ncbi:hypothetical protein BS17DRAFT_528541, partial [Gyrodon lividus]